MEEGGAHVDVQIVDPWRLEHELGMLPWAFRSKGKEGKEGEEGRQGRKGKARQGKAREGKARQGKGRREIG